MRALYSFARSALFCSFSSILLVPRCCKRFALFRLFRIVLPVLLYFCLFRFVSLVPYCCDCSGLFHRFCLFRWVHSISLVLVYWICFTLCCVCLLYCCLYSAVLFCCNCCVCFVALVLFCLVAAGCIARSLLVSVVNRLSDSKCKIHLTLLNMEWFYCCA